MLLLFAEQERIKSLKEDKKQLAQQLQSRSTISSLRSIGVGDYDVDEDEVKIEKVGVWFSVAAYVHSGLDLA